MSPDKCEQGKPGKDFKRPLFARNSKGGSWFVEELCAAFRLIISDNSWQNRICRCFSLDTAPDLLV